MISNWISNQPITAVSQESKKTPSNKTQTLKISLFPKTLWQNNFPQYPVINQKNNVDKIQLPLFQQ